MTSVQYPQQHSPIHVIYTRALEASISRAEHLNLKSTIAEHNLFRNLINSWETSHLHCFKSKHNPASRQLKLETLLMLEAILWEFSNLQNSIAQCSDFQPRNCILSQKPRKSQHTHSQPEKTSAATSDNSYLHMLQLEFLQATKSGKPPPAALVDSAFRDPRGSPAIIYSQSQGWLFASSHHYHQWSSPKKENLFCLGSCCKLWSKTCIAKHWLN